MDSDRRHELSKNLLQSWLVHVYTDFLKPYANVIYLVVIVALASVCIIAIASRYFETQRIAEWESFFLATGGGSLEERKEKLQVLQSNYTTGVMGTRARLALAQIQLMEGSDLLYSDRGKARETLESALSVFNDAEKVAAPLKNEPKIQEEIAFGIAMTYESLAATRTDKNDIADAEKKYREVFERWPDGVYAGQAKRAAETVKRADEQKLFLSLATVKPATRPDEMPRIELERGGTIDGPTELDTSKLLDDLLNTE